MLSSIVKQMKSACAHSNMYYKGSLTSLAWQAGKQNFVLQTGKFNERTVSPLREGVNGKAGLLGLGNQG